MIHQAIIEQIMTTLYILLVLLIVTRLSGEISERLGQPALLGELVSGICLGLIVHQQAEVFPVLAGLTTDPVFKSITDLGIFFLMLLGGIELQPAKLLKASKSALVVAVGGMIFPLVLGMIFGYLILPESELRAAQTLFLGTVMAVTAVPVSVKALMDLGKLDTKVGQTIISAAVIDDVLSLILLAVLTSFLATGSVPGLISLLLIMGKVILFFVIAGLLGGYLFPAIGKLILKSRSEEFQFSSLLIGALAYAMLAEVLGMHFILGAFLAGLFFRRRTISPEIYEDILSKTKGLTTGFFAPIFFASIGMHIDLNSIVEIPGFVLLLIAVATIGKLFGAGISARLTGMSNMESFAVGIGMNARGAVELVIADIALRAGIFEVQAPVSPVIDYMFSAIVVMAIVTTLMTPPALKIALKKH